MTSTTTLRRCWTSAAIAVSPALIIMTASPRAPNPQPQPESLPGAYRFHTHYPGISTVPPRVCGSPCAQGRPTCGRGEENDLCAVDTFTDSPQQEGRGGCGEPSGHVDETGRKYLKNGIRLSSASGPPSGQRPRRRGRGAGSSSR